MERWQLLPYSTALPDRLRVGLWNQVLLRRKCVEFPQVRGSHCPALGTHFRLKCREQHSLSPAPSWISVSGTALLHRVPTSILNWGVLCSVSALGLLPPSWNCSIVAGVAAILNCSSVFGVSTHSPSAEAWAQPFCARNSDLKCQVRGLYPRPPGRQ